MRFNELISGVRSDVGVKIFGDDLDMLLGVAQQVQAVVRGIEGAADVKTEQVAGLPMLTVKLDRQALSRYGLSVGDVQNLVEIAVGGKDAGQVVRGRPALRHRRAAAGRSAGRPRRDQGAADPAAAGRGHDGRHEDRLAGRNTRSLRYVPLSAVATIEIAPGPNQISRENGKRRIVVSANVRGRDLALLRRRGAGGGGRAGQAAGRLLDRLGRAVRATGLRHQAADDRRAGGAAAGVPAAVHEHRIGRRTRCWCSAACRWR